MIDDVEDKVRRNLIVGSTVIILIAFLQVPIKGTKIGVLDLHNVSPLRVWIAALCILLYLILRFHKAPSTVKTRDETWRQYRMKLRDHLDVELHGSAQASIRGEPSKIAFDQLQSPDDDCPYIKKIEMSPGASEEGASIWSFTARCQWSSSPTSGKIVGSTAHYKVSFLARWGIRRAAWKSNDWFQWAILDTGIPYLIAMSAFFVCALSILHSITPPTVATVPDLMPFMCGIFEL